MRTVPEAAVRGLLLGCFLFSVLSPAVAVADGALPPLPYRYLHPPPALAANNQTPRPVTRTLGASVVRSSSWSVFTPDGQAGIGGAAQSFALRPAATGLVVKIQPVEAPPGLRSGLAVDGNAYSIMATEQPGDTPAQLKRSIHLTLRWPHIPTDVYIYASGHWRRLCASVHATFSPSTISCSTSGLGTFAAVTLASMISSPTFPTTPVRTANRFTRYIPLFAALAAVIVAALLAFLVTRPDRGTPSRPRE